MLLTHHKAAIYKIYVTQSNALACASRRRESVQSEAKPSLKQLCRNCFDPGWWAFFPTPHAMATIRGFETRQKNSDSRYLITNEPLARLSCGENQKVKTNPLGALFGTGIYLVTPPEKRFSVEKNARTEKKISRTNS